MPELQKPVKPQPVERPIEPEEVIKPNKPALLKSAISGSRIMRGTSAFWLSGIVCVIIFIATQILCPSASSYPAFIYTIIFGIFVPVILFTTVICCLPVKKFNLNRLKKGLKVSFIVAMIFDIILAFFLNLFITVDISQLIFYGINCVVFDYIVIYTLSAAPFIISSSIAIEKIEKFRKIAGDTTQEQLSAELENYKTDRQHYKQYLKDYRAYKAETEVYNMKTEKTSLFTGGAFAWFGIKLLAFLITLFSLGIAYPFAVCFKLKWQAEHTYICGRKQYFDGNGAQLFGKYVIWWLLSVITFGIYFIICGKINIIKWQTSHTHFKGEEGNSVFDGKWYQLLGVNMLTRFVTIITLSFGQFWAHCYKLRWEYKHKTIDGFSLKFEGKAIQYFAKRIVWLLLTVLTLGIYSFWLAVKSKKWTVSHINIDESVCLAEPTQIKEETKNF